MQNAIKKLKKKKKACNPGYNCFGLVMIGFEGGQVALIQQIANMSNMFYKY